MKKTFPYRQAAWVGALVVGIAWAVRRFRLPDSFAVSIPLAAWLPGLIERHGETEARRLAGLAEQRCRDLIAGIPPQTSPALRAQLVRNIYPGLALYQTLLEAHQGDRLAALAEIEPLFKSWTQRLYGGMMRVFQALPFPFFFFRLMFAIQRRQLADNIFQTHMLEDSFRRVAMDQFGCPYLTTLREHGAAELTPYFCQIDDWMADMLPREIAFRRTKTLARGDDRCDFRYEKTG